MPAFFLHGFPIQYSIIYGMVDMVANSLRIEAFVHVVVVDVGPVGVLFYSLEDFFLGHASTYE
jgi:hypothetical protein